MTECVIAALGELITDRLNNMAKSPPQPPEESRNP